MTRDTLGNLKDKEISNCKELAKRIKAFQIDKIKEKIEENLKNMEEFFYETYKGFYCSICDYNLHKYFNI